MAREAQELESVRLDKWLFAVRAFKTRNLAAEAIASGRVKMEGHAVKSGRQVRVGDLIDYREKGRTFRYEVVKLLDRRVGAKDARECYVLTEDPDLDEETREMMRLARELEHKAPRTRGRPTKRDRRMIQKFKEGDD